MQPGTEQKRNAYKISKRKYKGNITLWRHRYRHKSVDLKPAEYEIMNWIQLLSRGRLL
jgi:hypothetical protein